MISSSHIQKTILALKCLGLLWALTLHCQSSRAPTPPPQSSNGLADAQTPESIISADNFIHCSALPPPQPNVPFQIKLQSISYRLEGGILSPNLSDPPQKQILRMIGMGETREGSIQTLKQLRRFAEKTKQQSIDAIFFLGGLAPSFEGIRDIFKSLAGGPPVAGFPGEHESLSGFQAALRELGSSGIDMTLVRAIKTPQASFIAVPGFHLPHHLFAKEQGCSYDANDIEGMIQFIKRLPKPRVLLAHIPPRGSKNTSIDSAYGDLSAGDPLLRKLIQEAEIQFGLFSHIHESGGKATDDKENPVKPGTWANHLFVNVGSADGVPLEGKDGKLINPGYVVFEIFKGKARFHVIPLK